MQFIAGMIPMAVPDEVMFGSSRTIEPPARVPHTLKECSRMPVDEMDVAADCFFEKGENAMPRMLCRKMPEAVGEVPGEVENHAALNLPLEEEDVFQRGHRLRPGPSQNLMVG